jgi:hypothetical protein
MTSRLFAFSILCLALSWPLLAQLDQASLSGTITDPSTAVIPGAKVEAVSMDTGFRRQTTTTASGTYQIPSLAVGKYIITISSQGFRSAEFRDVELTVGQPRTIDAQLSVGSLSDAVEIAAPAEILNRSSAEVGGLIEAEQIKEIPVSGRNWASLMLLAPGAINYGDGSQRSIRFNGHSIDDANYTFDGIDNTAFRNRLRKRSRGLTSRSIRSPSFA